MSQVKDTVSAHKITMGEINSIEAQQSQSSTAPKKDSILNSSVGSTKSSNTAASDLSSSSDTVKADTTSTNSVQAPNPPGAVPSLDVPISENNTEMPLQPSKKSSYCNATNIEESSQTKKGNSSNESCNTQPPSNKTKDKTGQTITALDDPNRQRVVDLLAHRKMILERLRKCRKAAEERLNYYAQLDEAHEKKQIEQSQSSSDAVTEPENEMPYFKNTYNNKQEEVQAYRQLSTSAMQFNNRRPAEKKSILQAPRAISLRTGSSVGNKMKAAVATLTSNAGWATDSSSLNQQQQKAQQNFNSSQHSQVGLNAAVETGVANSSNLPTVQNSSSSSALHGPLYQKGIGAPGNSAMKTSPVYPEIKGSNEISNTLQMQLPSKKIKTVKANDKKDYSKVQSSGMGTLLHSESKVVSQNIPGVDGPRTGKQLKTKKGSKGKKSAKKQASSSNIMSSSGSDINKTPAVNMPLHHGIISRGDFVHPGIPKMHSSINMAAHSDLPAFQQPLARILCPETDKLRKKRRSIEAKLEKIFLKKFEAPIKESMQNWRLNGGFVPTSDAAGMSRKLKKGQLPSSNKQKHMTNSLLPIDENPYLHAKPLTWKNYMGMGCTACLLPEREKTQWDHVLEEMRWLATDFVEERKWKTASARTLSSAISTFSASISTPIRLSPLKQTPRSKSLSSERTECPSDVKLVEIKSEVDNIENDNNSVTEDTSEYDEMILRTTYEVPSIQDLESARSVSKILSKSVEDHWELMLGGPDENNEHFDGPNQEISQDIYESSQMQPFLRNQFSYEEITNEICKSLSFASTLSADLTSAYESYEKSLSQALEEIDIELHISQIKALQFVEMLWNDANPKNSGFILDGALATGKTFSTCTLFWRRREKGPQLLICPAESVIRWRNEFKRFTGLRVLTFGEVGWSGDSNTNLKSRECKPFDVLVCESSMVKYLLGGKVTFQNEKKFTTIAIDTRFLSQLLTSSQSSSDIIKSSFNASEDFTSNSWWSFIIKYLLTDITKAIIISSTGTISKRHDLPRDLAQSQENTKKLEVMMSLKVAFLQHHIFYSKNATFGRRTFWWAKKFYGALKTDNVTEESKKIFKSKLSGARGVLGRVVEVLTLTHEEVDEDLASVLPKWTIQLCPLSKRQRRAYERDCNFVRGYFDGEANHDISTVTAPTSSDSHVLISKALLRLRRTVFHSNLHNFTNSSLEMKRSEDNFKSANHDFLSAVFHSMQIKPSLSSSSINFRNINSSQSSVEFARSLLENSSKLQQLFNILYRDCGCDVNDGGSLLSSQNKSGRKRKKKKKVLILSCLADTLQLTSLFLNSVGISHELLMPLLPPENNEPIQVHSYLLKWTLCQQAIARFEKKAEEGISCDIIMTSPEVLGSKKLGLSAANAEYIISIDEDWSGRSSLHIYSILMKNCIQADSGGGRKYIKLISEDTCEESFLTFVKKSKGRPSVYPIPLSMSSIYNSRVDMRGYLSVDVDKAWKEGCLLGYNVLRCKNLSLSSVLCTDSVLPPSAVTGKELRFLLDLPQGAEFESDQSNKADADLVSLGNNVPSLLDDKPEDFEMIKEEDDKQKSTSLALSLTESESTSSLYFSGSVNRYERRTSRFISTARDITSKHIQLYVEYCKNEIFVNGNDCSSRDSAYAPVHQLSKPATSIDPGRSNKSHRKKASSTSSASTVANVQIGSIGVKAASLANSLLVYSGNDSQIGNKDLSDYRDRSIDIVVGNQHISKRVNVERDDECIDPAKKRRMNKHAVTFSLGNKKLDGNQGCESLIYFPPLFPFQHSVKDQTIEDVPMASYDITSSHKRKSINNDFSAARKKMRSSKALHSPGKRGSLVNTLPIEDAIPLPIGKKNVISDLNLITSSDADFMESSNALFDDEFLPDLNLDKDVDVVDEELPENYYSAPTITELNEDFGLLGSGKLIPLKSEMAKGVRKRVCSNPYSFWLDPFEPILSAATAYSSFCDSEEAICFDYVTDGPQLETMILRVKLRPNKPYNDRMHPLFGFSTSMPPTMVQKLGSPTGGTLGFQMNARYMPSNGGVGQFPVDRQISGHKKKKKSSEKRNSLSPTVPNMRSQPQPTEMMNMNTYGMNPSSEAMSKSTGLTTQKVMTKERKVPGITSLFQSPAYLGRSILHLRNNLTSFITASINEKNTQISSYHSTSSDESELVSIKLLSDNERTGDAARAHGLMHLEKFRCEPHAYSVDFGPFSVGLVREIEAINPSLSVQRRLGIKLPMGVKIPFRHRDFARQPSDNKNWSELNDRVLLSLADRFGHNWHVVSQVLTWQSGDTSTVLDLVRSARQCQERWSEIAKKGESKPQLDIRLINTKDTIMTENSVITDNDAISILITPPSLTTKEIIHSHSKQTSPSMRSRFHRLKKAGLKSHYVPLNVNVPRYSNGSNSTKSQTQMLPPHLTHLQSVKNAVSMAAGPSGMPPTKLEMWPLQFLDVSEKQRQHAAKRKQNHNNSGQTQATLPNHTHSSGIRVVGASTHQKDLAQTQQNTIPKNYIPSTAQPIQGMPPNQKHPGVVPGKSPSYPHPMHPNSSSRMNSSRR